MRWQMVNEASSTQLAIIISYPTSASAIIFFIKNVPKYEVGGMSYLIRPGAECISRSTCLGQLV